MTVMLLRYQVAETDVASVTQAVEAAFAELRKEHPTGFRFSYYRVSQSAEFVGLLELSEGLENPLPKFAALRALKATVDRVALGAPPLAQPLRLVGEYAG